MVVIVVAWIPYAFLGAMVFFCIFALGLFKDKSFVDIIKVAFWTLYISVKLMLGFLELPIHDA